MSHPAERIGDAYRRFAAWQARGRSDLYEQVSLMIADDDRLIAFLAALPPPKWQPNLLLAAVQYLFGTPDSPERFRSLVLGHGDRVADVMLRRTTQTNQPARCATLLPALARIGGPLALLEVGASAGLCLLPDHYDYEFADPRGVSTVLRAGRSGPVPPRFACRVDPATPRPSSVPDVVWRAGLDLNPLDVHDADDRAWLDALVWPGEEHVRTGLHRALDVARADPPPVRRGDLRTDLAAVAADAPADATLVVFHTAVLAYLFDAADRDRFAADVGRLRARRPTVWLANETPSRIPGVDPAVVAAHPPGEFLLCSDGRPLARTDPHGAGLTWLG